ncbi:MAG TPA: matrixin family metalloprotease [Geminicoccaceae bacterium]|nr:matrixin family metalloprotease [Geminicoccaceae bacterium]
MPRTAVAGFLAVATTCALLSSPQGVGASSAEDRGLLKLAGHHVKWGVLAYGNRATVTYAYLTEPRTFRAARNCRQMTPIGDLLARSGIEPAAFDREVAAAFALWAAAADLRFARIDDAADADIVIGAQAGPAGVAFTNVFQEVVETGAIDGIGKATICLDPSERWEVAVDGDPNTYNLRYVAAHEVGHAIGLDHRGRDQGIMGFAYQEKVALPDEIRLAATDAAAAARLYGPAAGRPDAVAVAGSAAQQGSPPCLAVEPAATPPAIACGLAASGN